MEDIRVNVANEPAKPERTSRELERSARVRNCKARHRELRIR
jgi:hypothetical protein